MPPRELFTQATGPSDASSPYGQPSGPPTQPPRLSPPAGYQQQYQQPSNNQGFSTTNSYPYAAQQMPSQVPSPGQGQGLSFVGQAYPSPTNTAGANPYALQQPQQQQPPFYSQGTFQQQGQGYPAPPPQSPSSLDHYRAQDPSLSFPPQDFKNAPPPDITPPISQPPPSPFPAVRDPYASNDQSRHYDNNMSGGLPTYVQQPGAGPVMTMDPKNAKGLPRDGAGEREWSSGICGCFDDCGTCCLAVFCPCMVYSQVKTRLSHLETQGRPHPEGGDMFGSDCFVSGLLNCCGFGWVLQIGSRGSIRDRYRISGNGCTDCLAAWCCTPCDLTQESIEIQMEERALTGKPIKA